MLSYIPKYFTSKAIYLYFICLVVVFFAFIRSAMMWYWFVFGIVGVVSFFFFSNTLTRTWSKPKEKTFIRKLFWTAFSVRLAWVVFSYFFYTKMTGQPFDFYAADALHYHEIGTWYKSLNPVELWNTLYNYWNGGISDVGYCYYITVFYKIFGVNIFLLRVVKALLSALSCVLIYKLTARNMGENAGRIAAVFCMLMPNLIYYCGSHLKETEMVFLTIAFIERADNAIRSPKFSFLNLALPVLLAGTLFLFRTVLGAAALFSFFTALIFIPGRTLKGWKRTILVVWVLVAVGYFMGGRISTEVEEVWEGRATNQENNIEWRSTKKGGNQLARYASASFLAPAIFVLPFPTMVETPDQDNMRLLHSGYYVKNIMAFLTIFALIWIVRNKKWRDYALIVTFTISYLGVIALSAFASSERFHLPVLPFELLLAAFAVTKLTNKSKKYYLFYLVFVFLIVVGWQWFKLAGRGII